MIDTRLEADRRIVPASLTAGCLDPFATIVRSSGPRLAFPVVTEPGDVAGKPVFTVTGFAPVAPGKIIIPRLERHPHTSQTFIALSVGRWLIVVADKMPDGSPDFATAKSFFAGPGDAVCFHREVWHAPVTVLDAPAELAMLMWRADKGDDTVLYDLVEPWEVLV